MSSTFLRQTTPILRASARSSIARPTTTNALRSIRQQPIRFASNEVQGASPVHSHTPMYIVLAVLLGGGGFLYYQVKPIAALAHKVSASIDSTKETANQASGAASSLAAQAANLAGLGPLYAVASHLASSVPGGLPSFMSDLANDLKSGDAEAAIKKIKQAGGKDIAPFVEAAEDALKKAKNKAGDVDWRSVVESAKGKVGDEWQGVIDYALHLIPSGGAGALAAAFASGDYSSITQKLKEQGGDKLKDLEATAEKLKAKYEEITKNGKGSVEDAIKSLKDVQGEDLDKVLKQAKDLAKQAGIPADMIESWIEDKGGKVDTDKLVKQAKSYASSASEFADTDKAISAIKTVSPALAALLSLTLSQAGVKLGSAGQSSKAEGKEKFDAARSQIESLTSSIGPLSSSLPSTLQSRLQTLTSDLKKTLSSTPSISSSASAAKDSASQGEKTGDAKGQQKQWEDAVEKMKADARKAVEGAVKDLEKELGKADGKTAEAGKKALELVKGYLD